MEVEKKMSDSQVDNSQKSILIVDDQPASLHRLAGILNGQGYETRLIPNGKLALAGIEANPPDLILLDIGLAGIDSYEVCKRLKAGSNTRDIPVIFITASDKIFDKAKAFAVGATDYITKPYQFEEVSARVQTHLTLPDLHKQLRQVKVELSRIKAHLQANHQELEYEITQHKRDKEMLQLTQFSVDNAADPVFWVGQDTRLLYANEAAGRSLGYSCEELLAMTVHDIDPNYPPDVWKIHWHTTQQGSVTTESYHQKKNGQIFPVEVTFTYLEFDGRAYNFVSARDITWRRWATESLKESAERYRLIADRLQSELVLARDIQQGLLPAPIPRWSDLDVVCYTQPAREVGGDFYTYRASTKNRVLLTKHILTVGDISGKGASAALLMAASLSQLDASLSLKLTPAERMIYLDKAIMPYTKPQGQNCALCYIEIVGANTVRPVLKVVNAACIPPYVKHTDGTVEWPKIGGFALGQGLGVEWGYDEARLTLTQGDIIVLTSDGVIEATNATGQMFSFERLEAAITAGPQTSAAVMLDHLKAEVAAFVDETEPHDDMTIVVVRV
jgi:PAS domain S-box-containing protein